MPEEETAHHIGTFNQGAGKDTSLIEDGSSGKHLQPSDSCHGQSYFDQPLGDGAGELLASEAGDSILVEK